MTEALYRDETTEVEDNNNKGLWPKPKQEDGSDPSDGNGGSDVWSDSACNGQVAPTEQELGRKNR